MSNDVRHTRDFAKFLIPTLTHTDLGKTAFLKSFMSFSFKIKAVSKPKSPYSFSLATQVWEWTSLLLLHTSTFSAFNSRQRKMSLQPSASAFIQTPRSHVQAVSLIGTCTFFTSWKQTSSLTILNLFVCIIHTKNPD